MGGVSSPIVPPQSGRGEGNAEVRGGEGYVRGWLFSPTAAPQPGNVLPSSVVI